MTNIEQIINTFLSKVMPLPLQLGIEISYSCLKLVLIKRDSPTKATLLDYSIIPLAGGNTADAADAIKDILKDSKGLADAEAKFVISGSQVDTKRIALPSMPKEEIARALKYLAKEHLLLDIEESTLDFEILGEKTGADGSKNVEIIASIAENSLIEQKLSRFRDTKALPSIMIPVPYSLRNLNSLSKMIRYKSAEKPIALIDIGFSTTNIVILKGDSIRFTRQCGCAGGDLTHAMTGVLVSDKGKIELSSKRAEELKREVGLPEGSVQETKNGISTQQLNAMIRPVMEKLISEIKLSFEYYMSEHNEEPVSKVYLSGGTSRMKNICPQLSKALSLKVEALGIPQRLRIELPPKRANSFKGDFPVIAAPLGAALGSAKGMNLLPEKYKKERLRRLERLSARMIFIIIALIVLTLYLLKVGEEGSLRNVMAAKGPQWQKLREVQVLHNKISQKNTIANYILEGQPPYYYSFKALSNLAPRPVYFIRKNINSKTGNMVIEGVAFDTADPAESTLASFIRSMENSAFFRSVNLVSSRETDISGKSGIEFEISCKLKTE